MKMCDLRFATRNFAVCPFQNFFQIVQIIVGKHAQFRAAQFCGVHDAGMNELVENDDVVFAEQRANRADGGGIAGGKRERGFGFFEVGERFFKFMKRRKRAANQSRRAGACAEFFNGLDRRFFQNRIVGKPEIIVGGKIEKDFAADFDARRLRRIHAAQFAMQTLFAQQFALPVQCIVKQIHCRTTDKHRRTRMERRACLRRAHGAIVHRPSIMPAETVDG